MQGLRVKILLAARRLTRVTAFKRTQQARNGPRRQGTAKSGRPRRAADRNPASARARAPAGLGRGIHLAQSQHTGYSRAESETTIPSPPLRASGGVPGSRDRQATTWLQAIYRQQRPRAPPSAWPAPRAEPGPSADYGCDGSRTGRSAGLLHTVIRREYGRKRQRRDTTHEK